MKKLIILFTSSLITNLLYAQPPVFKASGSITSGGPDCSIPTRCVSITDGSLVFSGSAGIDIRGTFVATLVFEATIDGSNYFQVQAVNVLDGSPSSTATTTSQWVVSMVGYSGFRVRASSYTSGSVNVTITAPRGTTSRSGLGGSSSILAGGPMSPPSNLSVTPSSGGSLAAGTYKITVAAVDGEGNTTAAPPPVSCTVNGTTTNSCSISWTAPAGASGFRVYASDVNGSSPDRFTGTSASSYTLKTIGFSAPNFDNMSAGVPPTVGNARMYKVDSSESWFHTIHIPGGPNGFNLSTFSTAQPADFYCSSPGGGTLPSGEYRIWATGVDNYGNETAPVGPWVSTLGTGKSINCNLFFNFGKRRVWVQAPGDSGPVRYKDEPTQFNSLSELTFGTFPTEAKFFQNAIRIVFDDTTGQRDDSLYIGREAFRHSGVGNIFINTSNKNASTAYHNICIGHATCGYVNAAADNIVIGVETGLHLSNGAGNIQIGREALSDLSNGSSNIAIGNQAGWGSGDPSYTIYLGKVRSTTTNAQGEIVIGNSPGGIVYGKGSNTATYGGSNITDSWIAGNVHIKAVRLNEDNVAKPTCDSSIRGMIWFTQGGAGVKDSLEVCAKDATDTYAWRTIY